ncbi:MAG: methyltransferase domain-containing protein [Pseudomonadota bacterium]
MLLDAQELVDYYLSPLGALTCRLIGARLEPHLHAEGPKTIVGHGYATPYFDHIGASHAAIAVMPAAQGATHWPQRRPSRVVLAENDRIPMADESVDLILGVHSLESATDPRRQLREFWRVLRGEGRLVVVVPNRRGVWARLDTTPFGSGRPYSRGQLDRLLRDALFTPLDADAALFTPPVSHRSVHRIAPSIERFGRTAWPLFGGVVIVSARKQLAAPLNGGLGATVAAPERATEEVTVRGRTSQSR